jgi:hypothetical protein
VHRELTCCSFVHVPPERVAATLAPLRSLDPEVILAVDDRVDPAWIEGYRQLGDLVLVAPFPGLYSRAYPWLRARCSGRWILHLDDDEVPSADLATEVAETIAAGDLITHAWAPRRWLYPDPNSYLAQWPWRPDYQLRLFRNDPAIVRFPARFHEPFMAIGPRRFMRAPVYHGHLLIRDLAARERKVAHYETLRSGLVIDGRSVNEVFYLPEQQGDLRLEHVPASHAPAIAEFFDPAQLAGSARGSVAQGELEELVGRSEDRSLTDADYRASITLLEDDLRIVAGHPRTFDVEVSNLGTTYWPGGLEARPQIRLGHRWTDAEGERRDGGRTPIGAALSPGETAIVPLEVMGPDEPGIHEIEIDLVHELVRWFGCAVNGRVEVLQQANPLAERT